MSQVQRRSFRVRDIIPASNIPEPQRSLLPTSERAKIIVGLTMTNGVKRNVSYWPDAFAPYEPLFREAIASQQVYWFEHPGDDVDFHATTTGASEADLVLHAIADAQTEDAIRP